MTTTELSAAIIPVFSVTWWTESLKEQHLFEIEIISKIINVFTVTFLYLFQQDSPIVI